MYRVPSPSPFTTSHDHHHRNQKNHMGAPDCYILFFDGASRSNPRGPAGHGWILYLRRGPRWRFVSKGCACLGMNVTSNQAEYEGLIAGLEAAHRRVLARSTDNEGNARRHKITVRGDSELIVRQMTGVYQVKSDNLTSLYSKARGILGDIEEHVISVKFQHIAREYNSRADELANQAIAEKYGE